MTPDYPPIYEVNDESRRRISEARILCARAGLEPVTNPPLDLDVAAGYTAGCGPGKFGDLMVPDNICGIDMFPICQRHDERYYQGQDRRKADLLMYLEGLQYIEWQCFVNGHTRKRKYAAMQMWITYYIAVDSFGEEYHGA